MERSIVIPISDARLILSLLNNEKVVGEYSMDELMDMYKLRDYLEKLVWQDEKRMREHRELMEVGIG